jgi:hypothetical protein
MVAWSRLNESAISHIVSPFATRFKLGPATAPLALGRRASATFVGAPEDQTAFEFGDPPEHGGRELPVRGRSIRPRVAQTLGWISLSTSVRISL